jgi:uncharacterized protein (DUF488 family)
MNRSGFNPIYTIGHSLHTPDTFCQLLIAHKIEVVLDVRSSPYSRRAPHFNRSAIQSTLGNMGVRYSLGGHTLGGRPVNPDLYVGGQASYELMAASEPFVASLRKVARGAKLAIVALLCAEADPIECHRFLLIGRALHARGLEVRHILPDGSAESHMDGERRMLVTTNLSQRDAFAPSENGLALAYERQSARYAFTKPLTAYQLGHVEWA